MEGVMTEQVTTQMMPKGWKQAIFIKADTVEAARKEFESKRSWYKQSGYDYATYDYGEKSSPRWLVMFRIE